MKNIKQIVFTILMAMQACLVANAQCPADPSAACTSTISANTATPITANSGDVICITGGTQSGAVVINSGGKIIVSGGTVSNNISVLSGGTLIASGGTLNNGVTLPTGASMFVKNTPTINGSMTVAGGTINVLSGGTFSKDVAATSASVINNCGTISGTRNYNSNVTLNNYSSSNLTLGSNSNILNNFANNVTIQYNSPGSPGKFTNSGTGVNFNITSSWNTGFNIANVAGASITMTMPGANVPNGTVFDNAGTFTESTAIGGGTFTINNSTGGTFNFSSNGSSISPTINNSGTIGVTGNVYLGGGTTNNNGTMTFSAELRVDGGTLNLNANSTTTTSTLYKNNGTINMGDHSLLNITQNITTFNGTPINLTSGCATIMGSSTPSNVNGTVLSNVNLNFCGAAPMQAGGTINTITSVADNGSGAYRITMASGPANNQYIEIAGVTGVSNLNGYWQVTRINATTFDLIGSTFMTGAVFGSSQVQISQSNLKLGTSTYIGYSGCTNPCAPLPIRLVSFKATKVNGSVSVIWETAEEKNNRSYTVQRSTNGINYTTLDVIAGTGNSSSLKSYSYYDFSPLEGISYYRLMQTDIDGKVSYSSVSVINFDTKASWNVYPNPSIDGSFTIESDYSEADVLSVTVTDVSGNQVKKYSSEEYKQAINITGMNAGLYIITIQTTTNVTSKKLIVR